jgi:hypothetical protein
MPGVLSYKKTSVKIRLFNFMYYYIFVDYRKDSLESPGKVGFSSTTFFLNFLCFTRSNSCIKLYVCLLLAKFTLKEYLASILILALFF